MKLKKYNELKYSDIYYNRHVSFIYSFKEYVGKCQMAM